jgi:transposase-like protein
MEDENEVPSIDCPLPTLHWLRENVTSSQEKCIQYLLEKKVITLPTKCKICGKKMNHRKTRPRVCQCGSCSATESIFENTIFSYSKIDINILIEFMYDFLLGCSHTILETRYGFDDKTVTKWMRIFRRLMVWDLAELGVNGKVGGRGKIVQIDEAKFGVRKYNRGHRVNGVWVVGGIDEDGNVFAIPVEDRSAVSLMEVITRCVHPGSIIYTDCWKGYRDEDLMAAGMAHGTVNHSQTFLDRSSGVHINNIEATWSVMKQVCPKGNKTIGLVGLNISTYIWKKRFRENIYERFLSVLQRFRLKNTDFEDVLEGFGGMQL